ncbi:MAG: hypothetical protein C0421_12855 [Hyphomonas sp.]|nr:hypothetical protein [Hyphomonas sp.]
MTACATPAAPAVVITDLSSDDLPGNVRALAEGAAEGFLVSEAQKKVREGRIYYDVEGSLPDGSEIEFDILMTVQGPEIVEIQRDMPWAEVPASVRAAAEASAPGMLPARVIESRQPDGAVIYELFAPGAPADPAMEVSLMGGAAAVLAERWPH